MTIQPLSQTPHLFIFDVESIGLHGQAFAVAGGILTPGATELVDEFCYAVHPDKASGSPEDRDWVRRHVPPLAETHPHQEAMAQDFWTRWRDAADIPGMRAAADCTWPVEASWLSFCVKSCGFEAAKERWWTGPYPFIDIGTLILAAGGNPTQTFNRLPSELPAHHPLQDSRQSARIASELLWPKPL